MTRMNGLLAGVAGLGLATTAFAAATAATSSMPVTPEATASEAVDGADILVTARKRSERLQDVPVAVSAFSAASLARQQVYDIADLSLAVPSVLITQTGGSANAAQIFIRGFGQDALGYNSETPVGIYFDDVYLGRTQGTLLDILDVERVEILRGPQGTLYGRNSTTGAVKIVPRAPDLNTLRAVGEATFGSYNRTDFRGAVSMPLIGGKLAAKLDLVTRHNDGYLRGVDSSGALTGQRANGTDRDLIRGALAWAPAETVRIDLAADYSRDRSGPITGTAILCVAGANSACRPRYGTYRSGLNYQDQQRFKSRGVSGKVAVDLGFAELKSITAYRGLDGFDPIDLSTIPGTPSPILYDQTQDQFTQELQLISSGKGRFEFAAGLFYFHEKWTTDTNFLNVRRNRDTQKADSYAAYGEVYFRPVDRLTLTVGGRVTRDEKEIFRQIFIPRTVVAPTTALTPPKYKQTVFTPKVALDFKANDDLLLYASYSRGYRPGGYGNTWPGNALAAAGRFDAEKTDSYEIGVKASPFEGATLNAAAYRIEYKNLQQGSLTPTAFVITSSDARVQGIELEAAVRPFRGLSLTANVGLLDDKITRSNIVNDNLSRRLRYAPKWTYKIGGEYDLPVSASTSLFVAANYARVGATPQDQANTLGIFMPAYGLLDAQAGIRLGNDRYKIGVGGKNLTDRAYWRSGVAGQSRFYAAPRTFLVTLAAKL